MFDISENSEGQPGGLSSHGREVFRTSEAFTQRVSDCPSILSELSREMRTQMNAIVAFSFLLKKDNYSDTEKDEFANMIFSSCEQIISLFDNFLDSAIIDTGNLKTEPLICKPDEMFREIYEEFRETLEDSKINDIELMVENPESTCGEFFLDTKRYTRVIRNLFQLALHNTKSGYIKTGYYLKNKNLVFFILDTGQGYFKCREFFQSKDLAKSFRKYSDATLAVNIALVRRLVQIMNGAIAVESNRLTGSAIYVSIPVSGSGNRNQVNKYLNSMSTF